MTAPQPPMPAPVEEPEPLVVEYPYTTSAGEQRKVLVAADAIENTYAWSVYDVPSRRGAKFGWFVERLDAHDDKLDAAIGVARAYQESQIAFHTAGGDFCPPDPMPKPTEVPIGQIRKDAALAKRFAATAAQPTAVAA